MKKQITFLALLFGVLIIFSSCDPEEMRMPWWTQGTPGTVITSESYLMIDDARHELSNAYIFPTGKYLQLFLFSKTVPYDDFMSGFTGSGTGIFADFDFPASITTLPAGDYTYLKQEVAIPFQGKNFSSCRFAANIGWWMTRNKDLNLLESGTATIAKSNSTYTINISGKDTYGREIKCYYKGAIREINKVSNHFDWDF
jgi:hypothetical protein